MKNKLGFTLIELLAVIIILAIVALIATPIVLDVIEDARISAGRSEANIIYDGINKYCLNEEAEAYANPDYIRICTSSMNKDNVKDMVNLGNATVDELVYNGEKLTTLVITSNNHKFTLCSSGTFAMDDENCPRDPNSLITKLLEQYSEGNTTGLVKDKKNENLYYYTGTNEEVANNFLWYGGHQWRVLEFDTSANTLTLVTQQPLTTINPASAVWETQEAYESSYINKWLNDYFWNSLDNIIQSNIKDNTFNIGISTDIDEITTTQKVGLLDGDQYKRAGYVDSYLDIKDSFWLGNRVSSSGFLYVGFSGYLYKGVDSVTDEYGVRAVIKISDIIIAKGNGTLESNYRTTNKATTTNNVQVGEYINVPYSGSDNACGSDKMCTFRVISKDNDSIKVVLNGLLPNESTYGNSVTISTSHTIYTKLNAFAEGIIDTYRYTGNKTFYIGDYPYVSGVGQDYEIVKDETLEANIGLPTVGEMFSGNDIDLGTSSAKTFVDINTIENPSVSNYYWTMNRINSSDPNRVTNTGSLTGDNVVNNTSPRGACGVRAVIYLKSGTSAVTFTGGEGTPNSPYTLQ